MNGRVAIVGAGMAGLSTARVLRGAGVACTLFDKSRGLGGRMATRRTGDLQFDHGAQYFTAKGEGFRALVSDWVAQGGAAQWFDGAFVGAPGMTAPARAMAQDCELVAGCEVKALRRGDDGRWTLMSAAGDVSAQPFDAVVMALPAPQIEPIAASAGLAFAALAGVRYAPCWALMLAFERPVDLPWTHLRAEGADAAWIARDATKPGRSGPQETFVVHASADWSRRNLERTPEWVVAEMLPLFAAATGVTQAPVFAVAHRWRYALVEEPAGAPCVWDEGGRIGACGDWCIGPRVEAAFESGQAMAHAVLSSLGECNGR